MKCYSEEKFGKVLGSSFLVEKTKNEERRTKNNSGVTLIGIIAAIVVMGLLGAGVLMLVSTGSMESIQTLNWGQAFYAAESGVSAARAYMATNVSWKTNSNLPAITGAVGQASFIAILDTNGGIASIGSKDEAQWTSIWRPTIWRPTGHGMLVYGSGSNPSGTPRYRLWGGTNWSAPSNALPVGSQNINWVVVKACPRRDEYIAATIDASRVVKAQVYRGGSWGNLQTIATNPDVACRGVDIAYETRSGDALVVAANGIKKQIVFCVWSGAAWSGPVITNLNIKQNAIARWVKLASDPVSDEIIVMVQDDGKQYIAQVWNYDGDDTHHWGKEIVPSAISPNVIYESMAVEYETSGSHAVIVSANAALGSFKWSSWNGINWSGESTNTIGNDFLWGTLVNDPNSDNMLLTYIDADNDIGKVFWNGTGTNWTAFAELETNGNAIADRCVQGQFETISTNAGHAIIPYSDTIRARSRHSTNPSGSAWGPTGNVSTITNAATVQTRRTGDGKILAVFFTDVAANIRYDFSWYDGTNWSATQTLETATSVATSPYKEPFMMAPQLWVLP